MADFLDFFNEYIMGSIQMLTGFHFFVGFLRKNVKWIDYVLFAVMGDIIVMIIPSGSIAEFPAYVLLLVAGGIFVCKADSVSAVLYAAVTAEIMQLCYGIFSSVLCILYPLTASVRSEIVGIVFMMLGHMAVLAAAFCYCIMRRYFPYYETVKSQYTLMLLTPALLIFLIGEYISSVVYGNTITTDSNGMIGNTDHCRILGVQLLGMASLFCMMFAYKKLLENFRLSMELSLLEQEEYSLGQYVEEAMARYKKTTSFRHDIKNHITMLKGLLQKGRLEQALNYIGDMADMTEELSFPCSTNNPVTDILIGNKLGIAISKGIDVHCSLRLPYPCPVRDIDFCMILSNALDNAIHACEGMVNGTEKYIHVNGHIQGDFILLEVENSFQGKGLPTKGTGLSNIKMVAEKYHGMMSVKVQDTVFILSVLLIIPQQPESISQQIGSFAVLNSRKRQ